MIRTCNVYLSTESFLSKNQTVMSKCRQKVRGASPAITEKGLSTFGRSQSQSSSTSASSGCRLPPPAPLESVLVDNHWHLYPGS